jgi:hypothetical protein
VIVPVDSAALATRIVSRRWSDRQRLALDALNEAALASGQSPPIKWQLPAGIRMVGFRGDKKIGEVLWASRMQDVRHRGQCRARQLFCVPPIPADRKGGDCHDRGIFALTLVFIGGGRPELGGAGRDGIMKWALGTPRNRDLFRRVSIVARASVLASARPRRGHAIQDPRGLSIVAGGLRTLVG